MIQAGLRLIDFSQKMTMVAVQIITILDRPADSERSRVRTRSWSKDPHSMRPARAAYRWPCDLSALSKDVSDLTLDHWLCSMPDIGREVIYHSTAKGLDALDIKLCPCCN
jgi:hypothetical protein